MAKANIQSSSLKNWADCFHVVIIVNNSRSVVSCYAPASILELKCRTWIGTTASCGQSAAWAENPRKACTRCCAQSKGSPDITRTWVVFTARFILFGARTDGAGACYDTSAAGFSKLSLYRALVAWSGFSGVTPGQREELTIRRVSFAARQRRPAHAE